ncbi:hypothetical protein [Mucilaginibacter aquatilis]|uniref:Uncharacterized protein n=1 Tax=Mucilaginibacter aquatilis TaxID=1517760 RepID=A0A6I4I6L2_9SPHI|nr:hypothetical protein [Mucilaginibacter aquatilis]MVN90517.1 hypothetical protein [Mucilaginibacter aquatilis]
MKRHNTTPNCNCLPFPYKYYAMWLIGLILCVWGCKSTQINSGDTQMGSCLNAVSAKKVTGKYRIDLYLETSQSMFGFMLPKKQTQFQSTVWDIASRLSNEKSLDFRIFQTATRNQASQPVKLTTFQKLLNSGSFQAGKQTDIPQIIDNITHNWNKKTVSILISDLIFSPGDQSPALLTQITTDVRSRFYKKPWASEIIKLSSEFNFRTRSGLQPNSPYYIWIIGAPDLVSEVSRRIKLGLSAFESVTHGITETAPVYSILPYISPVASAMATKCEVDHNYYSYSEWDGSEDPMIIPVAINLSAFPPAYQQPAYLKKHLRVECPGGKVSLVGVSLKPDAKSTTDRNLIFSTGATHLIKLKVEKLTQDDNVLSINIQKHSQAWIKEINDNVDDPLRKRTTGFSKLVNGLDNAYGTEPWLLVRPLKLLITKNSL